MSCKALENRDMPFGTFSSSEVCCLIRGKKKKFLLSHVSYCLVAQNSKISFPQTADESGNVEDLEVSGGSICTSVLVPEVPVLFPQGSVRWILFSVKTEVELGSNKQDGSFTMLRVQVSAIHE